MGEEERVFWEERKLYIHIFSDAVNSYTDKVLYTLKRRKKTWVWKRAHKKDTGPMT